MKAFTLPLLIAAMAYPCLGQAQDPSEAIADTKADGEIERADFSCMDHVDLNTLRGKPIKEAFLWKSHIEDISPLAGLPIKELVIFGCPVKDISPLKGMPLESLWIGSTRVTDISPLKGIPLKHLSLYASELTDISALEGMPLEDLDISMIDSGKITDLTPLKGMKLHWLNFNPNTVTKGMDIIRDMKSLEKINRQAPDEFWRDYDSDAPARKRLGELGVNFHGMGVAKDGSWGITFYGDDIQDLTVIKGLPINSLALDNSKITDLSPLEGSTVTRLNLSGMELKDLSALRKLRLKNLTIYSCPEMADISALKGMPLEHLLLSCPKVKNLSELHGMPLKTLDIQGTDVRDLSPLEGLSLERISVNIEKIGKGIKILRHMKSLKNINNLDVEHFWEEYDEVHGIKKKKTHQASPDGLCDPFSATTK